MTVVEKAAYLKGLVEGLGVEPESRDGKLWGALTELLSQMAHEIEDLQESDNDYADALDEIAEELSYLEELTCDLDGPEDFEDFDEEYEEDESCGGECGSCGGCGGYEEYAEYELHCPKCGGAIVVNEEVFEEGKMVCPGCGASIVLDMDEEE